MNDDYLNQPATILARCIADSLKACPGGESAMKELQARLCGHSQWMTSYTLCEILHELNRKEALA